MPLRLSLRFLPPSVLCLALVTVASVCCAAEPRDISETLESLRAQWKVPACAAAVVDHGRVTAVGTTGVRRIDRDVRVTPADLWHIGSCTKSMTAVLIGVLVDEGKLRWDMPVPEALPGVECQAGWSKVTVWDLVTQRSGIAPFTRRELFPGNTGAPRSPREQRASLARTQLARPPAEPVGRFAYSNTGYGLLGAMIDHATGGESGYEEMLRTRIFEPLGLKTAGFGAPATPGLLDQPWGHTFNGGDSNPQPIEPLPENQFPASLAPAGCVHMSLEDFARYAAWLSTGEPRLVKAKTFARLQTPPAGSTYAGGLWKSEFPGVGGAAVCHTGRMGGFSAIFYAGEDRACVAVYTIGDGGWEWFGDVVAAAALKATSAP